MPKYRFTTDDGEQIDRSDDPVHLPNDDIAAQEAQKALADIAKEKLPDGSHLDFHAHVEDDDGNDVYKASLKFRGQTAREAQAEKEEADRSADEAAETVSKAIASSKHDVL